MFPILIVDDAREDQLLAESVLRHARILNPIRTMTTGEECIRYFRGDWKSKDGENAEPCLLLIDLSMKPTSGLEVLRQIESLPLARQSIKIMVSGINDIKTVRHGYVLGAQTFFVKPLTRQDVSEMLLSLGAKISTEETPEGRVLRWAKRPAQTTEDDELLSNR
jgi:CheY-like chemotaxis protein